jgi:hypothetical protein
MKAQRIASGLLLAGAVVFAAGYRDVLGDECSGTKVGQKECPKDPGPGHIARCVDENDPNACPGRYTWSKHLGPFICLPPDNPPLTSMECGLAGKMTPLGWQPLQTKCATQYPCAWNTEEKTCRAAPGSSEVKDYYKENICPQIQSGS